MAGMLIRIRCVCMCRLGDRAALLGPLLGPVVLVCRHEELGQWSQASLPLSPALYMVSQCCVAAATAATAVALPPTAAARHSAIVKHLLEKHADKVHITVFDAGCKPGPHLVPGVTYIRGDVVAYVHVRNALEGMHCVVHTAALVGAVTTLAKTIEDVNLKGTQNVVEACLEHDICVLVHTSSGKRR